MGMLGSGLRELRIKRRLTQEQLAARANVTARTVRYWETNAQQPRAKELESALVALEAVPQEKERLTALLNDPRRARRLLTPVSPDLLGPLPEIGDLLRAMRTRRGWTQEQFADAMGISRATVIRWEATKTLPSAEDVARLASLLGGMSEERAALQNRRLGTAGESRQWTLEECAAQYAALLAARGGDFAQIPLMDLNLLALKRQLYTLQGQSLEALRLFAETETLHGWWLLMQGRKAEANAGNWRALKLARGTLPPGMFCVSALNVLGAIQLQQVDGPTKSMKLLYPWLRLLPASLRVWLLSDLAYYAGAAGQHEEAASLVARAEQAWLAMKEPETLGHHLQLTKARVLLSTDKPLEALECLPPLSAGDGLIHELVIRAEMYLAARDKNAAAQCLSQSEELLQLAPLSARQRKVEQLGQRL